MTTDELTEKLVQITEDQANTERLCAKVVDTLGRLERLLEKFDQRLTKLESNPR